MGLTLKRRTEDGTPDTPITHVEATFKGRGERQNLSTRLVEKGVSEGWLSLSRGEIVIHQERGVRDVKLRIVRGPGRYCCHCGEELADEQTARAHVAAEHEGDDSPDAENPSGYRWNLYYECEVADKGGRHDEEEG